jgi:hypothetical protein
VWSVAADERKVLHTTTAVVVRTAERMGERKVLIRYIPPDFDPSIIPKTKRDKFKPVEVRMMLPFSLRCNTCAEYLGRGKKFNSRKEVCQGEDYMGIKRLRFVIKCSVCSAEISFKTDPKNTDYECEYGASRNFELWKETEAMAQEEEQRRQDVDVDTMKSLESRTFDSKLEMDVLDALDEIKAINQRHERVDIEGILEKRVQEEEEKKKTLLASSLDDETILRTVKFASARTKLGSDSDEEKEDDKAGESSTVDIRTALLSQLQKSEKAPSASRPTIIRKKRKVAPGVAAVAAPAGTSLSTEGAKLSTPPSHEAESVSEKRAKVEVGPKAGPGEERSSGAAQPLFGFGAYGSSDDEN